MLAWSQHHGKISIYQKDIAILNLFTDNKIGLSIYEEMDTFAESIYKRLCSDSSRLLLISDRPTDRKSLRI